MKQKEPGLSRIDDDGCGCVVLIVAPIVFGVAGYWFGRGDGRTAERKQAVEAGVARYTAEPTTGETRFEYMGTKGGER